MWRQCFSASQAKIGSFTIETKIIEAAVYADATLGVRLSAAVKVKDGRG